MIDKIISASRELCAEAKKFAANPSTTDPLRDGSALALQRAALRYAKAVQRLNAFRSKDRVAKNATGKS